MHTWVCSDFSSLSQNFVNIGSGNSFNQCWIIISDVMWYSSKENLTIAQDTNH